jgi:catechol 2,3-dioxygenase-like lactoylglutathione lyase family enzyme
MHRSRLGVLLVDHAEAHDDALAFWAAVTGRRPTSSPDAAGFTELGALGSLSFAFQRTGAGTPARMHLDIETDDVAAEVRRVLAAGARLVDDVGDHAILEDPGGLLFCVVPVQDAEVFEAKATTWD